MKDQINKVLDIGSKAVVDKNQDSLNSLELIKAEVNSDSKFLKNARPSIIYVGLIVILLEMFGLRLGLLTWLDVAPEIISSSNQIIDFFLIAWGGVAAWYSKGRSNEKLQSKKIVADYIERREIRKEYQREAKHDRREERKTNRRNRRR